MRIIEYVHKENTSDVKSVLKNKLGFSSSLIKKLKMTGGIARGTDILRTTDKVYSGDVLVLSIPYDESDIQPVDIPIKILYEDEDVICIEKNRGIPSHPSQDHYTDTLANFALSYLKKTKDEFHIVTRLDSLTSGIVLAAKNQYSASIMCTKEYNKTISKKYYGICRGLFDEKEGIVEVPISRCDDSIIKRCVSDNGKYSKTGYLVEKDDGTNSLVSFQLYTGRTHQIRVHMSHINHPLLNDFLYDMDADSNEKFSLHCSTISFVHPYTKIKITVESTLPDYFTI